MQPDREGAPRRAAHQLPRLADPRAHGEVVAQQRCGKAAEHHPVHGGVYERRARHVEVVRLRHAARHHRAHEVVVVAPRVPDARDIVVRGLQVKAYR